MEFMALDLHWFQHWYLFSSVYATNLVNVLVDFPDDGCQANSELSQNLSRMKDAISHFPLPAWVNLLTAKIFTFTIDTKSNAKF